MGDGTNRADSSSEVTLSISANEKGKNKRKFLPEIPLDMPIEFNALSSLTEFPRYEMLEEKFRVALNELGSLIQKTEDIKGIIEEDDQQDLEEWDDPLACQLEELLVDSLLTTFRTAVKKIVEEDYTEEVAEWAILNSSSLFHGGKDALSNVVDGALAVLKKDFSPRFSVFEDLKNLVDYSLLEMIYVLREVKPGLTIAEAMWCLLIADLNLVDACAEEGSRSDSGGQEAPPKESPTLSQTKSDSNVTGSQPDTPASVSAHQPPNQKPSPGESSGGSKEQTQTAPQGDERSGFGRKGQPSSTNSSRRDMLRQKALHFEKNYRGRMTKGAFKAKVAAWGSMVLDKSLKLQSGSSSSVAAMKGIHSKLTEVGPQQPAKVSSVKNADPHQKDETTNVSDPPSPPPKTVADYYASIPFDETLQKYVPQDDKDEAILMLVPHVQALEKEVQGWIDWANGKIMQAAKRLGLEQGELKMMRQEKDDTEKLNKEKQTLEGSTMKRLAEMEHALSNATGQIDVANRSVNRLDVENSMLKEELEAAKTQALMAACDLHATMRREKEALKKMQSWDAEKSLIQEQLNVLRLRIAELENRLGKAKERHNQFMILFRQEEKERLKVAAQVNALRVKREGEEAATKAEMESIIRRAEIYRQSSEEEIKELEGVISELRLESDKSKIAALNVGYGESMPTVSAAHLHKIARRLAEFHEDFGVDGEDVERERECVMCMSDEISVVFLPCGHQVLCGSCSGLHDKQGMNDCPSCRATIEDRISVIYREV